MPVRHAGTYGYRRIFRGAKDRFQFQFQRNGLLLRKRSSPSLNSITTESILNSRRLDDSLSLQPTALASKMRNLVAPVASFLFLTLSMSQNGNGFTFSNAGRLASRPAFASSDRTLKRDRQQFRPHLYLSATSSPDEDPAEEFQATEAASDYDAPTSAKELKVREGRGDKNVGGYDPSERIGESDVRVGDPAVKVMEKERSVTSILRELAAIQQQGPQKYCILGTRHCSFLHQQIIELL
jgi:hypothetical protein